MSVAARRLSAFGLWAIMLAGIGFALLVIVAAGGDFGAGGIGATLVLPLIGFAYGTVGILLAIRVPENRVGWVFLAGGALFEVYVAAYLYMYWGVVLGWPGVGFAAWLNFTVYMPSILLLIAVPLLVFPSGHVPSPGWRWVMRLLVLVGILSLIPSATYEVELDGRDSSSIQAEYLGLNENGDTVVLVDNPLGLDFLGDIDAPGLDALFLILLAASFLGPAAAMVYRFRRAVGVERLQLKWLAYSASIAALGLGTFYVLQELTSWTLVLDVLVTVGLLGVLGIPVTAGLAVAKYRLYDIDRLISRTLTYTLVVTLLVSVFFAVVTALSVFLSTDSTLAVAGSTLIVAALFNPLRKRLQRVVDRRFNRFAHNAEVISQQFAAELQEPLTTDQLVAVWTHAVEESLQPETAGIWIKH